MWLNRKIGRWSYWVSVREIFGGGGGGQRRLVNEVVLVTSVTVPHTTNAREIRYALRSIFSSSRLSMLEGGQTAEIVSDEWTCQWGDPCPF